MRGCWPGRGPQRCGHAESVIHRCLALVCVLTAMLVTPAAAVVIWPLPGERGRGVFTGEQEATPGRIGLDGDALRFELRDGERPPGDRPSVERVEAIGMRQADGSERRLRAGDVVFIGWRQRFARDFPSPSRRWCSFVQLKEAVNTGTPLISMGCGQGEEALRLGAEYGWARPWRRPLERGAWQSFVLRVALSTGKGGSIALWHDGVRQRLTERGGRRGRRFAGQTIRSGTDVSLKFGVYRDGAIRGTAVTEVADARVATTYAEAAPPIEPMTFVAAAVEQGVGWMGTA